MYDLSIIEQSLKNQRSLSLNATIGWRKTNVFEGGDIYVPSYQRLRQTEVLDDLVPELVLVRRTVESQHEGRGTVETVHISSPTLLPETSVSQQQ